MVCKFLYVGCSGCDIAPSPPIRLPMYATVNIINTLPWFSFAVQTLVVHVPQDANRFLALQCSPPLLPIFGEFSNKKFSRIFLFRILKEKIIYSERIWNYFISFSCNSAVVINFLGFALQHGGFPLEGRLGPRLDLERRRC